MVYRTFNDFTCLNRKSNLKKSKYYFIMIKERIQKNWYSRTDGSDWIYYLDLDLEELVLDSFSSLRNLIWIQTRIVQSVSQFLKRNKNISQSSILLLYI